MSQSKMDCSLQEPIFHTHHDHVITVDILKKMLAYIE